MSNLVGEEDLHRGITAFSQGKYPYPAPINPDTPNKHFKSIKLILLFLPSRSYFWTSIMDDYRRSGAT